MQLQQRNTGTPSHELLELPGEDLGFGILPEPNPGDLFFDMEGDPYVGIDGIEYLFGITEVVDGELTYKSWWGHDSAAEKLAFEQFIDFVMQRLEIQPELHIYHYASYEVDRMKKLAGRYGTRETEVDALLRGRVFVDLYRVVRQSLRISQDSYSIKKLEPFYMEERETEVVGGGQSIVAYEDWLELGDQKILDDIEAYNKDDCDSTLYLRNWLEARRQEAIVHFGQDIPRPGLENREPPEAISELDEIINEIDSQLCVGIPEETTSPEVELSPKQQGRRLLGRLLEWHRRENKSGWWRHFELRAMDDDELIADREAVGGLVYEQLGRVPRAGESLTLGTYRVVVERVKRRTVERVYFERIGSEPDET